MDFTPINTQEEFDARVTEKYGDVNDLQNQITTLTGERDTGAQTIAELTEKVKRYETSSLKQRIAREIGIPAELADRLNGESEKDIKADANVMAGMLRQARGPAPMHNPEPETDAKTAAYREMLQKMKGE